MKSLIINRWFHITLLIVFLGSITYMLQPDHEVRQRLSFFVFDRYLEVKPRPDPDTVVIVDIDDASLSRLGQWPWSRLVLADMVKAMTDAGALAIAFDGVLAEPDRTSPDIVLGTLPEGQYRDALAPIAESLLGHDEVLAQALSESGIFVTGFTHGTNENKPKARRVLIKKDARDAFLRHAQRFKNTALWIPVLEDAAAGNGSFMAASEVDGLIRRSSLFFSDGQTLYPSLSIEGLRVAKDPKGFIKVGENEAALEDPLALPYLIHIGELSYPVDEGSRAWVYFREMVADDYLSMYKLLDPDYAQEVADKIADKIVMVGSSAEGLKDLRATPHDPFLPGVEIHANLIEQILQDVHLSRPVLLQNNENILAFAGGLLMILLVPFIGAVWMAAVTLVLIGGFISVSWYMFDMHGLLMDPVFPSLTLFTQFVLSALLTYIRTEAERKQVKDAFGLYISPAYMKELTENPEMLRLGGETRELTVMFTDIRSFTTISESLTPEELIQLMNDFLTPMSDAVMRERGTIDKYMGDAMMAFWNAPLDVEDHARHACRAALTMDSALKPINERLKEKAAAEGREPLELKAGIGIHTGPASVGNMGSKQRFAYSAIGDSVNLASRLEGQSKFYGASILISEETRQRVKDYAALELDLIRVKGKTEPVRIFALIGDDAYAAQDFYAPWAETHEQFIKAWQEGDFHTAKKLLATSRARAEGRMADFYDMYEARIKDMLANPVPAAEWDGVFTATSK